MEMSGTARPDLKPILEDCQFGSAKYPLYPPPLIDAPVSLPYPEQVLTPQPARFRLVAPTASTLGSDAGNSVPRFDPSGFAPSSPEANSIVNPCAASIASLEDRKSTRLEGSCVSLHEEEQVYPQLFDTIFARLCVAT